MNYPWREGDDLGNFLLTILNALSVLSFPLMILNVFGAIVAGIWLMLLGEWGTIGVGLLGGIFGSLAVSFLLLPIMLFMAPAAHLIEKRNNAGFAFFVGLTLIYQVVIMTLWCCGILHYFMKDATAVNYIPTLIWSYSVATGPWAYLASKDQVPGAENIYSLLMTFFAELAYVIIMVLILFSSFDFWDLVKVFLGIMFLGMILQLAIAIQLSKEQEGFI